jgi:spore coat protein CotH
MFSKKMKKMKKLSITFILFVAMVSGSFSQGLYDINTINTIEITFVESNWDYLLDQLYAAGDEERLVGSVMINGQQFDSVGIRYKGNSTYNANQIKNPLNVKLDYIIDDQLFEDYGTLKLANVTNDPSFVRETMSYEIARKYMPAGQSNYANVYINGTHLGLYTSDQDVDKFFMRTHFNSDENVRVKGDLAESLPPSEMGGVWEYFGADSSSYYNLYDMKSDFGWKELVEFLDILNNDQDDVDQVLNVDRHLWFLAFSNLLVNLDGPVNNPQNYYLYQDDAGRFNPII